VLHGVFAHGEFLPHGMCLLWDQWLVLTRVVADSVIALAYYSIPVALIYFISKRRDLAFRWMFLLFGVFIFLCGTTHAMDVWTLWHPDYWLEANVKAITAVASAMTAALLWPMIPAALALPSPADLTAKNRELTTEIGTRKEAEAALWAAQAELESRVQERTSDLSRANVALQQEIVERKRIEELLRASEARLAGMLDTAEDTVISMKLYLEAGIRSERNFEDIIGKSAALRRVLKQVETVAPTESTVLIYGETGTGKELIARAIHNLSPRHPQAFVKLNCAAIPTGLLESELFGHERGAFTGAIAQRIGRFELAHRGTVFLDEIGDIPLELQPKLLRVLQEREFERLGSGRTLRSDARLIAATNTNLASLVAAQKFRADLFYRLNVFPIHIPPLRERAEDIPLLVRHFVQHFNRRMNRTIETVSSDTIESLTRYPWPGNIRELENVIERAVILSPGPVLRVPPEDLEGRVALGQVNGKSRTLEEAERELILATVKETKWVLSGARGAATRLGLNRSTLQFRMKKLGIVRPGS
jgi:transcriptional regulator with GAF, ATPase, and Fis domain